MSGDTEPGAQGSEAWPASGSDINPTQICSAHKIPLGPDGLCIQCQRELELSQMAQSRSGYQVFVNILAVLLVLGGAAAVGTFFVWPWWERLNKKRAAVVDPESGSQAVTVTEDEAGPRRQRRWGRPVWPRRWKRARRPRVRVHAPKRVPRQIKSSLRLPHDIPEVKIIRPEIDNPRRFGVGGASRRVRVVVYVTSWCPACRQARNWLRRKQISHTVFNVERDSAARMELRAINPRGSIPTFKIGRQVLVGFSPQGITQAILRASR